MSLINTARSRSADPLQEALRAKKAAWNKACSEFIARLNAFKPKLIAFKQGINGKGNAKAGLPPSDIKAPLPNEINGYMGLVNSTFGELASEFASLVSESNAIIQEQAQYAEHRRKPQPRQPRQADISKIDDDSLIVEGSNRITRLWAQLSSVLSSDETKRQRLSMLGLSDRLFKNLVKFEDLILTSNVSEMEKILNSYLLVSNNLDALKHDLQKILKITNKELPKNPPDPSAPSQSKSPVVRNVSQPAKPAPVVNFAPSGTRIEDMDIHQLKSEVVSMQQFGFTIDDIRSFLDFYHANKNEKDPNKMLLIKDRLQDMYEELFTKLKHNIEQDIGHKLPTNITLAEIRNLQKSSSIYNTEIEKFSGNFLSRYYNKYRHERSKDPSSASRIEIYNTIREMKINVNAIMDLLEQKALNIDELVSKVIDTEKLMAQVGEPLNHLNMLYKDKYYEPGSNKRKHNILDPAGRFFNRQIQRDVDRSGW